MFKVGKQVETALLALKELELNSNTASITSIAEKYGLSKNTLSKILQTLIGSGHLMSVQGTKGGYRLQRPLAEISFFELLTELNEVKQLTCNSLNGCEIQSTCTIQSPLKKMGKKI